MRIMINIYTDGGSSPNPGLGAWGAILMFKNETKEIYKEFYQAYPDEITTNNQMELLAAINALSKIKDSNTIPITLHSDSNYLIKGMNEWLSGWKNKNFKDVKNVELWKQLDMLNTKFNITWVWVKGHASNKYNNRADELVNLARKEVTNI